MTSLKALPPSIVTIGVWASTYRFWREAVQFITSGILKRCPPFPTVSVGKTTPPSFSSVLSHSAPGRGGGVGLWELKLPGLLGNTVACSGTGRGGEVQEPGGLQCVCPKGAEGP